MPIYVYHCSNCDFQFDQYQRFTDESLTICPECGRPTLHKVYQPVGIVFKGKGFYATDNRSTSGLATSHAKEDAAEAVSQKAASDSANEPVTGGNGDKPASKKADGPKKAKEVPAPVAAPNP
ncbi:MAG TPA: FmdB family zinc ribbon protein [Anaerolineaceae bacterium]|nr:FmdB family zinc ribbon protein [Anaerolineaceae bacterium]